MDRLWIRLGASALFLAISVAAIYGVENQPVNHGIDEALPEAVRVGIWLGIYPLMGFAVGRWWAVPLAFLPIPAGASEMDEDRMASRRCTSPARLSFSAR